MIATAFINNMVCQVIVQQTPQHMFDGYVFVLLAFCLFNGLDQGQFQFST